MLGERAPGDPFVEAFRQGLRDLGYTEGRSLAVEYRYAHANIARIRPLAAELAGLNVDLLVVGGIQSARAAKAATTTIPIVFATVGDPVGGGVVANLARPGGNATGLTILGTDLTGKQLDLLKTAAPQVSRVSVLYNPTNPNAPRVLEEAQQAARTLNITLQTLEIQKAGELTGAFAALTAWRANAVVAISDPVIGNELSTLAQLAIASRLPAIYLRKEFVEAGGLLAYGPSFEDSWRRAATYVHKILSGAKPAELPVEQPAKFVLAVNMKTAKALGIAIPPSLVARADMVVQ